MLKSKIPFLSLFSFLIILVLSFIGSISFVSKINFDIEYGDKYIHYCMYFIFTLILLFEINSKNFKIKFILLKLTFLAIFLSGIIEIMQEYLTDHRSGEWMDFLANSLGSLTALLFFITFKKFLK